MLTATSQDGTTVAFDKAGQGPALVLVDGAMSTRSSGSKPALVARLAKHFTVVSYDRRGRGDSGDTLPYAVQREIEDIDALIVDVGAPVFLYGHSSGGSLALEAAATLVDKVAGLAIYEGPYKVDPADQRAWGDYIALLSESLRAGHNSDAVARFLRYVGNAETQIDAMRTAPFWASLEAIAPTLAYDHTYILGHDGSIPLERARQVVVPTLVMHGGDSFAFMGETAHALSALIPGAILRTVKGQDHNVDPGALTPVVVDFFTAR